MVAVFCQQIFSYWLVGEHHGQLWSVTKLYDDGGTFSQDPCGTGCGQGGRPYTNNRALSNQKHCCAT